MRKERGEGGGKLNELYSKTSPQAEDFLARIS
jgi:hypothetical protein